MYGILIIEDDEFIREELKMLLTNAGYLAECVTDFENIRNRMKNISSDLILLDINLPGQDGYSICTWIRSYSKVPILFITGRDTAMDELQALTLGGDDYITKPYNIPILLARVNLLLRKAEKKEWSDIMEYKGIQLHLAAGVMVQNGKKVELTKTELKIMYYLFRHMGEIVPRLDLVEYLWDNEIHIDDNALSVNMMRLREKLHILGKDNLIQTRRGMGYMI